MKKIKSPFTNPISYNWNIYKGDDNNFYILVGYDKFMAIYECQIFDDYGNVSYEFVYGNRAKINGNIF